MIVSKQKRISYIVAILIVVAVVGVTASLVLRAPKLPNGFASGNGRIEATEVDIATKLPGRLLTVLVKEGDMVKAGKVLARMDTKELEADLRGTQAQLKQARVSKKYSLAIVSLRKSELSYANKQLKRSKNLAKRKLASKENLDRDNTNYQKAEASLHAAEFKVAESSATIEAVLARIDKLKTQINESVLKSPVNGRVLYRLREPGEVLAAGGRVLTLLNLTDVYMTIFLSTRQAGKVSLNSEARIVFDARPELRIPAKVSFVAPRAQFTPKEVETKSERDKLMFRIKVKIPPALLIKHIQEVKTGVTGVSYIRLDPKAVWPKYLHVKLPD